jgi:hypothetical protein
MELKMKALKIIPLIIFLTATMTYSQTVVVGAGAELNLGSGVDVCSGSWGNISGNITGTGTSCNSPMPVEMVTFSASVNKTNVTLSWLTSSEVNNRGFEIYRSSKNMNTDWTIAGFVNGSGTKNTPSHYSYSDRQLSAGKYYYRLKQIDYNGNFEYHNLNGYVEISGPNKYELSQNYPNPFNPVTKINFAIPVGTNVSINVYDVSGKQVNSIMKNKFLEADYYSVVFDASKLSSGIYYYRIETDKFTSVKKMVVLK